MVVKYQRLITKQNGTKSVSIGVRYRRIANELCNLLLLSLYRIGLGALPPSSDPKVTKIRACVGKVSCIILSLENKHI